MKTTEEQSIIDAAAWFELIQAGNPWPSGIRHVYDPQAAARDWLNAYRGTLTMLRERPEPAKAE